MRSWSSFLVCLIDHHTKVRWDDRRDIYISSNGWSEITFPLSNCNDCAVEVWEQICNSILRSIKGVITYLGKISHKYPQQWSEEWSIYKVHDCGFMGKGINYNIAHVIPPLCFAKLFTRLKECISNFIPHFIIGALAIVVLGFTHLDQRGRQLGPLVTAGQLRARNSLFVRGRWCANIHKQF